MVLANTMLLQLTHACLSSCVSNGPIGFGEEGCNAPVLPKAESEEPVIGYAVSSTGGRSKVQSITSFILAEEGMNGFSGDRLHSLSTFFKFCQE